MDLSRALRAIDRLSGIVGGVAGVLLVLLVVLVSALVGARYALSLGWVAGQEAAVWLHASAFLLGLGYALRDGAHVRVDVFSQRWSARTRAAVECLGGLLLLLPLCVFLGWMSWDYVAASWAQAEGSRDPGGLPGWYLLKSLLPLSALLLGLQGLAGTVRAGLLWRQGGEA